MNLAIESALTIIACCGAIVALLMTISFVTAAIEGFQDWWTG
jgi:hypothetical protein